MSRVSGGGGEIRKRASSGQVGSAGVVVSGGGGGRGRAARAVGLEWRAEGRLCRLGRLGEGKWAARGATRPTRGAAARTSQTR